MNDITYAFDTTYSKWIIGISRSDKDFDGMVIANVIYMDQQIKWKKYYNLYFWVSIEEYERLAYAESQGSYYWNNWSVYGKSPKERYTNQEVSGSQTTKDGTQELEVNDNSIDSDLLTTAMKHKEDGTLDDFIEDNNISTQNQKLIEDWIDRIENSMELYERTQKLRMLIETEQLTTKMMMKTFMLDIQELFGVSFDKRFMYSILNKTSVGKLNPNQFMKYRFQMKEIYDVLDKEGIQGLTRVGTRMASAKNPLIRSRTTYKGTQTIRQVIKNNQNWLEGSEAEKAIQKFHKKTVKEYSQGFKSKNSMYLEKKVVNGEAIFKWRKDATIGRKFITLSKKALRVAKWFIFI